MLLTRGFFREEVILYCEEALLQVLYLVCYQKKKIYGALKEIELKINGDKNPFNQSI